jgi:hypothetical protein
VIAALPWLDAGNPQGLAFRLRLVVYAPALLCAAYLMQPLDRKALLVAVAVGVASTAGARYPDLVVRAQPEMVAATTAVGEHVADDDLVIVPERHLLYMLTWQTRRRAQLQPPDASTRRLWRLLPGAYLSASLRAQIAAAQRSLPLDQMPIDLHPRIAQGLVLMRESTFAAIVQHLPLSEREYYRRWPTY